MDPLATTLNPYVPGTVFPSLEAFKVALKDETIARRLSYKVHPSNSWRRYVVICRSAPHCPFYLRANPKDNGEWRVSEKYVAHTCMPDDHNTWRGQQNVRNLVNRYQAQYEHGPGIAANDIMAQEQARGKAVHYHTANRAVHQMRITASGDDFASFKKIPSALEAICQAEEAADPQSFYRIEVENGQLHRLFFIPGHCIEAFRSCRRFIAIDGTFLKSRWDMTLLVAVFLDGNNEILPLAFAFVPSEAGEHWRFFLRLLRETLPEIDDATVTIISDRGTGLIPSVRQEMREAHHSFCAQHICQNMMERFHPGDELRKRFWLLAKAPTEQQFQWQWRQFQQAEVPNQVDVEEIGMYLNDIPHQQWAMYANPNPRYGHTTSNIAESINSAWRETVREATPFSAIKLIWEYVVNKFYTRRLVASNLLSQFTPYATRHIEEESRAFREEGYRVMPHSPTLFSVMKGQVGYAVDLVNRTCACPSLFEHQLPCRHVIAVITYLQSRPQEAINAPRYADFVHNAYHADTLQQTYAGVFQPVNWSELDEDEDCGPCREKSEQDRRRKNRRVHGNRTYVRENQCGLCRQMGHNRRSRQCPLYGQRRAFFRVPGAINRIWKRMPQQENDMEPAAAVDGLE